MRNKTKAEARKEINRIAKENGFIMKEQNSRINNTQAFKFENRETGKVLISNMTFWSAYDHALNTETWLDKSCSSSSGLCR